MERQSPGASATAERMRIGADTIVVRVASATTRGALLAADVEIPAGGGPPALHRHDPEEVYRIESGELSLYVEDDGGHVRRSVAGPGDVVHIPGGRAHTVRNESGAPASAYVVFTPGAQMEGFLRAAGALTADGPPDMERVLALAARHGIEITGPLPER
jgi:oxalate decarboxylase/phosphoglucose isomerase-like protein (cupin superfamily)